MSIELQRRIKVLEAEVTRLNRAIVEQADAYEDMLSELKGRVDALETKRPVGRPRKDAGHSATA